MYARMNISAIVGTVASENRSCVVSSTLCRCSVDIDPPDPPAFCDRLCTVLYDHDECSTCKWALHEDVNAD